MWKYYAFKELNVESVLLLKCIAGGGGGVFLKFNVYIAHSPN